MKTVVKRLWIVPVVMIIVMYFVGCGGSDIEQTTDFTNLTIEVVGEGTVTPSEGNHQYDENDSVQLKAYPADGWEFKEWIGAVADTGSKETTISMDGDLTVKAVFVTADTAVSSPDNEAARVHMVFTGEEFRADYDAWNCSGLEGEWKMKGDIEIFNLGTISGETTFTMPPRPDNGPWESLLFDYTMSGTLNVEDGTVDVNYAFDEVVFTIIDLDDGPTLGDARGKGTATVTVNTPDISFTVSETYFPVSLVPALIIFERHPECN